MDELPLSWAQDVLRFSLSATASSTTDAFTSKEPSLTDPTDPGKDPRLRKLVEAVLFSRRFLLTYNVVLLAALLVFTTWHWGETLVLAKRRRKLARRGTHTSTRPFQYGTESPGSSSSSTIGYTSPTPFNTKPSSQEEEEEEDHATDTQPLLATHRSPHPSPLYRPYYLLKYLLQYQPSPLPLINKTLPPNSISLLVLAFLALNFFYNFYNIPLTALYLFPFADRCGILFVANLPLLYLLSAKNQPVKFLTGYSYESLNIFHRRVGELLCFEAFIHFAGMALVWYSLLRRLSFTLAQFVFNRVVLLGLAAFVAYEVLYFTSLGSVRRRAYELFLALHVGLQIVGLVALWFHHRTARPYVGIALGIFVVDRVAFRFWLRTSMHTATVAALEDGETVLLSGNWDVAASPSTSPKSAMTRFLAMLKPNSMCNGWTPNSHVFLTVPELSNTAVVQAHPFTIFSAAPAAEMQQADGTRGDHAWFSLLIRAQYNDGFAHRLLNYALEHHPHNATLRIRLDGPYGSSHAQEILGTSASAVVIAGGSGIAVAYPLLYALLCPSQHDTEVGRACKGNRKVTLLWIVRCGTHRAWLPEEKLKELEDWGLVTVMPPPTSEAGRPDVGLLRKVIAGDERGGRTGVVVSGPDGLVRDVRNTCAGLIRKGSDVSVQVEKFGW